MPRLEFPGRLDVGRHPPVAAGGEGYGADLRTVRYAGALELLGEEPLEESLQPVPQRALVVCPGEGLSREEEELLRGVAEAEEIVEIEVVQLVRAHQVFCLLLDLPVVVGRDEFRADRGVGHVQQDSPDSFC